MLLGSRHERVEDWAFTNDADPQREPFGHRPMGSVPRLVGVPIRGEISIECGPPLGRQHAPGVTGIRAVLHGARCERGIEESTPARHCEVSTQICTSTCAPKFGEPVQVSCAHSINDDLGIRTEADDAGAMPGHRYVGAEAGQIVVEQLHGTSVRSAVVETKMRSTGGLVYALRNHAPVSA